MLPSTNKFRCWDVDKLRNVSKQYFMPLTAFSALYFLWTGTADWIRYKVSVWHNCPQCHAVITLCHLVKHGLRSAWSSIIAWISVSPSFQSVWTNHPGQCSTSRHRYRAGRRGAVMKLANQLLVQVSCIFGKHTCMGAVCNFLVPGLNLPWILQIWWFMG